MRLIPIYSVRFRGRPVRWSFRPIVPGQAPETWAWVADEARLEWLDALGVEVLVEPGRRAPRFAHELHFESTRQESLPLSVPEPERSPRP